MVLESLRESTGAIRGHRIVRMDMRDAVPPDTTDMPLYMGLTPCTLLVPSAKPDRMLVCIMATSDLEVVSSLVAGHIDRIGPRKWVAFCPKALEQLPSAPVGDDHFDHRVFKKQGDAIDWILERAEEMCNEFLYDAADPTLEM